MTRLFAGSLLAIALFFAGSRLAPVAADPPRKGGAFEEHFAGTVPTEWGNLVTISGTPRNYTLVFENDKGEIRILDMRGSEVPRSCTLIRRRY